MTARDNEQPKHSHDNMAKGGMNGPSPLVSGDANTVQGDTVLNTAAPSGIGEFWGLNPTDHDGDRAAIADDVITKEMCTGELDVESEGLCCKRRETGRLPRDSIGASERSCCDENGHSAAAAGYSFRHRDSVTKDTISTARRRHHSRLYPQYLWSGGSRARGRATRKRSLGEWLRLTLLAIGMSVTFIGMVFAGLVTFWALFPVSTRCQRPDYADGQHSAVATFSGILQETGSSPLYINQLQVSSERAMCG